MTDAYPQRIVCLTEEPTEVLYALGEEHRIVGISGFTVRPPQARREKPKVSAFTSAKIGEILKLEPDLAIGFSDIQADIARELIKAWINKDEAPHTATSTDTPQKFNSGGLDTDDKFSFVFKDKGEYPYFCALHPHMKASITVK